jgi:hypothetical protein
MRASHRWRIALPLLALGGGLSWWWLAAPAPDGGTVPHAAPGSAGGERSMASAELASSMPPLDDAVLAGPLVDWHALARARALAGDLDARWLLATATAECLRLVSHHPFQRRPPPRSLEERLQASAEFMASLGPPADAGDRARQEAREREARVRERLWHAREIETLRACEALDAAAVEEVLDWWEPFAVNGGLEERLQFAQLLGVFAIDQGRALRHLDALQRRAAMAERWMSDAAHAGEVGPPASWLAEQYWPGGIGFNGRAVLPADPRRYAVYALARLDEGPDAGPGALAEAEARVLEDINGMAPLHGLPMLDAAAFATVREEAARMRERAAERQERARLEAMRRGEAMRRARDEVRPWTAPEPEVRTPWRAAEARAVVAREARLRAQAEADEVAAEARARMRGDATR